MKKSKWFNKQYILLSVSILLGLIVLIVGSSYAYYIVNITGNDDNNDVAVKTSNINLDVSNVSGSLSLCKAYPISDTEGLSCTPYQFTLTNNNKTDLEYYLNLEYNIIPGGDPNLDLNKADYEDTIKVAFAVCEDETCTNPDYNIAYLSEILDNPDTLTEATSKYSGKLLTADKTFGQGDANKKTYSIILWIDINSSYQNATVDASITAITYTITKDLKFTVAFDLQDNDVWTDDTCKSSDGYEIINDNKCQKQVDVKNTYGTIPKLVYNNEEAIWYSDQTLSKAVTSNTGYLLKKYQINYSDFTPTCSLAINSNSVVAATKNKLNLIYQGWNENYTGDNETSKEIVLASDTAINTYNYYIKDQKNHTNSCSISVTKVISESVYTQIGGANEYWVSGVFKGYKCYSGGSVCYTNKCCDYRTVHKCSEGYTNYNDTYCYKY